jgi:hypothetical protein
MEEISVKTAKVPEKGARRHFCLFFKKYVENA